MKLTGSDIISAKSPSAILATRSNISNKDLLIGLLIVGISFLLFISVIVYTSYLMKKFSDNVKLEERHRRTLTQL